MNKFTKFAVGFGVAASLISAASFAQANTYIAQPASLTTTQVSAIIGLLQAFGADSTTIANVTAALYGQPQGGNGMVPTPMPMACSQFTNLKYGDTDAWTGGLVSQLQRYVGIYPTTGYYGVKTSLGFKNICMGGNAQPTSVSGMSKYTDTSFGFSFWYPSGWSVTQTQSDVVTDIVGNKFTPSSNLLVTDPNKQVGYTVTAVSNASVTGPDGGCFITYYFDSSVGRWMQNVTNCDGATGVPTAADVSNNTMGGLHELASGGMSGTKTIVPLSATKFVVVSTWNNDRYSTQKALADTVVATDPTVAQPVSTTQQIATIQAEANAYGVGGSTSNMQTYTNPQYGFTLQYPSNFVPVTNGTHSWLYSLQTTPLVNVTDPAHNDREISVGASTDPTDIASCTTSEYAASGHVTYNGITFTTSQSSDPAAGQEGLSHRFSVLHNGVCFQIANQMVGTETGHLATQAEKDAEIAYENSTFLQLDSAVQSFQFTR